MIDVVSSISLPCNRTSPKFTALASSYCSGSAMIQWGHARISGGLFLLSRLALAVVAEILTLSVERIGVVG